jgi:hypothetical protein
VCGGLPDVKSKKALNFSEFVELTMVISMLNTDEIIKCKSRPCIP